MSKFPEVSCSQCGRSFGPGDHGFSHCFDHPPFRDGNIYFWRWKDDSRPYAYHCKSGIAVAKGGHLIDTYWSSPTDGSALNPDNVDLNYRGNEAELVKINHWEVPYYEPEDVINMRHANNSGAPVYVRSDAERSQPRILEHLQYKRERAESEIRMAQNNIERLDAAIANVTAGELGGYLP